MGNQDLTKEDLHKIPMESSLKAFYSGCKICTDFSEEVMIPALAGILAPSQKEKILISVYRSIHCWMKAVALLNNTVYFQTVATAARSIFELALDIKLIVDNKIENGLKKFETFHKIEKFRIVEEFAKFQIENPDMKSSRVSPKRMEIVSDKNKEKEMDVLAQLWGKPRKDIRHWSGLGMRGRVERAGKQYEIFYYESFGLLSIYVHSGLVGTINMSDEGLKAVYGNSAGIIYDMFLTSILMVAKEFKFDKAMPKFEEWMKKLDSAAGEVILEEKRKYIKD